MDTRIYIYQNNVLTRMLSRKLYHFQEIVYGPSLLWLKVYFIEDPFDFGGPLCLDVSQTSVETSRSFLQLCLLQDVVQVTGRVACDSHGKLNSQSVVLEGSRLTSSGHTIPVDLSELKQYALFPGQVQNSLNIHHFCLSHSGNLCNPGDSHSILWSHSVCQIWIPEIKQ